jgi:hypothetical protein
VNILKIPDMKPKPLRELGENETVLSFVLQNHVATQPLPSQWTSYNFEGSTEESSSPPSSVFDDTFEDDGKGFHFFFFSE